MNQPQSMRAPVLPAKTAAKPLAAPHEAVWLSGVRGNFRQAGLHTLSPALFMPGPGPGMNGLAAFPINPAGNAPTSPFAAERSAVPQSKQ